ncbi:response regulator transcription factor [Saccharothrix mutabilis subsp. mutabilis]|uniref:Response regulator transcription factor n=1 Tax=Saccharothrix mutabilis subsp. mutabilis TaxID=66855 RepID=A0ABP3CS27_9PSEU
MAEEALPVLIVDDHPTSLMGLRALLAMSGFSVVDECRNGEDAVRKALEHKPAAIVMDLRMPRREGDAVTSCGAEVIREIRDQWPDAVVVVLTMDEDDEPVLTALRAGARSYLRKSDESSDLVQHVRLAVAGKAVIEASMLDALARRVPQAPNGARRYRLTNREQEMAALLADGLSNRQIARELGLQPKTVDNRISDIRVKLGARDRAEAVVIARDAGFGPES